MKRKYEVGDIVICIKDDPKWPEVRAKGCVGKIQNINVSNEWPYRVVFKNKVNFSCNNDYIALFTKSELKPYLTKLKLKKLLEE